MAKCTGTVQIRFGPETIPCRVYAAVTEPPRLSFSTLCRKHGVKVETVVRCPIDRSLVEKDAKEAALTKGYEIGKGKFLTLSDEDLAEVQPEPDPVIVMEAVVELAEVDPIFFRGTASFLGPDVGDGPVKDVRGERIFAGFVQALREASDGETMMAIGRWHTRGCDKLVAIRPFQGRLVVQELRRAGDIRDVNEIETACVPDPVLLDRSEPVLRRLRIESFDPSAYPDDRYDATVKLLTQKAAEAATKTKRAKAPRRSEAG
jgi:DNA end-binding protein Ku